jgi:hypothetical protein
MLLVFYKGYGRFKKEYDDGTRLFLEDVFREGVSRIPLRCTFAI